MENSEQEPRKRGRPKKQDRSIDIQPSRDHDISPVSSRNRSGKQRKLSNQGHIDQKKQPVTPTPISTHPSTLAKRNSLLNTFYDTYLGPSLDHLPANRLPLKRVILQRYRGAKSEAHHTRNLNEVVEIITSELCELWDRGAIPRKDNRGCSKAVKTLISKWVDAKQEERMSQFFQDNLDSLFDIRPAIYMDDEKLEAYLKKSNGVYWMDDLEFFKGQLKKPQDGFISPTRDKVLDKKIRTKELKASKAELFRKKNIDDTLPCSSTQSKSSVEKDLHDTTPRRSAEEAKGNILMMEKEIEENIFDDPEWNPPLRLKRKLNKKPSEIVLTLPSADIPAVLASVSTVTKTSTQHELKLVSTLLRAGGADITDTKLSISTIRRQRKSTVQSKANSMREKLKELHKSDDLFIVLHCDGKIIQYLSGSTEDRLAIAISAPNSINGQFLASPVIEDGKGVTMANCLVQTLNTYELLDKVEAVVFDTTASNTGKWRGCVPIFERLVKRALLWLACRHHISELFIKHACAEIRGPTTGPDDVLFKLFKKNFHLMDLTQLQLWTMPANANDWRRKRAADVLAWANRHMCEGTWPREDYRELVELTVRI